MASRSVTDEEGNKWRLCAGVAVLNSRNEILVGERIGKPGSWQAPQGGVDEGETVSQAAVRELYEEVGLEHGRHVQLEQMTSPVKCCYRTAGTGSWLEKGGLRFVGQELNWTVFRCADASLERDPSSACVLTGLDGEEAEFSAVRWESLERAAEDVWEAKRRPYEALRDACGPLALRWDERCGSLGFAGRWERDATRSVGVAEALAARGLADDAAARKAGQPYVQRWEPTDDGREWKVTTFSEDGETPRRVLVYPMGDFVERHEGESTLFGGEHGGEVRRRCFYLAEGDSDDGIAHVTVSDTQRGKEESVRYLKDGELILKRAFVSRRGRAESTEVFRRC